MQPTYDNSSEKGMYSIEGKHLDVERKKEMEWKKDDI